MSLRDTVYKAGNYCTVCYLFNFLNTFTVLHYHDSAVCKSDKEIWLNENVTSIKSSSICKHLTLWISREVKSSRIATTSLNCATVSIIKNSFTWFHKKGSSAL